MKFFQLDRMLGTFRHMYADLGRPTPWTVQSVLEEVKTA